MNSHKEIIKTMEGFVESQLSWLTPVAEIWQPSDLLPELNGADWQDKVGDLRKAAEEISDEVLVVLVGDTITEEALPSYQTMVNRHEGLGDDTGATDSAWAKWTRGWTAEENRHGQVLTTYLYISGRVNMRAVEQTTQHLIQNGFDAETGNDPYKGLIYTSFQERATRVSHGNVARLANQSGDSLLGKICNRVAGDEARHEEAYKRFVEKIFELDPEGALKAFSEMMRVRITMPAKRMSNGAGPSLFDQFAAVAQRIGVYTARDYAGIIEHLVDYWKVSALTGLSPEGAKAQEHLCGLGAFYRKFAERMDARLNKPSPTPFSWVFNRPV